MEQAARPSHCACLLGVFIARARNELIYRLVSTVATKEGIVVARLAWGGGAFPFALQPPGILSLCSPARAVYVPPPPPKTYLILARTSQICRTYFDATGGADAHPQQLSTPPDSAVRDTGPHRVARRRHARQGTGSWRGGGGFGVAKCFRRRDTRVGVPPTLRLCKRVAKQGAVLFVPFGHPDVSSA